MSTMLNEMSFYISEKLCVYVFKIILKIRFFKLLNKSDICTSNYKITKSTNSKF